MSISTFMCWCKHGDDKIMLVKVRIGIGVQVGIQVGIAGQSLLPFESIHILVSQSRGVLSRGARWRFG